MLILFFKTAKQWSYIKLRFTTQKIEIKVSALHAPYILTKPLHNSQRLIKTNDDKSILIHLFLIENFEFERQLLGFGDGIEVLKPERLRNRMKYIIQKAFENYKDEVD